MGSSTVVWVIVLLASAMVCILQLASLGDEGDAVASAFF